MHLPLLFGLRLNARFPFAQARVLLISLVAGAALPVSSAPPAEVPETAAESAELTQLNQEIADLEAKLKAKKDRKAVVKKAITDRTSPPSPSPLPIPTLPGDDKLAASFAEFRSEYHFVMRQSVIPKAGNEEPALFQYTMPAQGDDSWLADVGIGIAHDWKGFMPALSPTWKLGADYHYNDAAGALKDSFAAGGGINFLIGKGTEYSQPVALEAGYKRDNLVSGEGITGSLTWRPTFPGVSGEYFQRWTSFLNGRVVPYLGVETESGDGLLKKFKDGERWSAIAGITVAGELFPNWLGNRLEVSTTLAYWNHFSTSGGYDAYDDNQAYFSGLLTYWLDRGKPQPDSGEPAKGLAPEEKHFGLTVKYVHGDNPGTGEFEADVWTFGLSVKF